MATQRNQRGISLIELITVISILGVIASVASVFIRGPIDAYVDSTRRAGLTDTADTAMRRIARDIRKALPNSTRISYPVNSDEDSTDECLEFIPTKMTGRYRAVTDDFALGNTLNFVALDPSFHMFGLNNELPSDQRIEGGDWVAVYNLGPHPVLKLNGTSWTSDTPNTDADAYTRANISKVSGVSNDAVRHEATISFLEPKIFPLASGSKRFYVIPKDENIVAYMCDDSGNLRRTTRDFGDTDALSDHCGGPDEDILLSPILASNVASCEFSHDVSNLQRNEPVRLTITFTDSGESISLYHQVYENNWP
jgi:MSHA biogenesis protein MshO